MNVIGIDLGTTFSAVAHIDDQGNPRILNNREGERVTPSVVNFDENGNPLVGSTAKDISTEAALDTVQYVKRSMGNAKWRFVTAKGKEYTAEEISAMILKRMKEDAESVLGGPVRDAVVTVPAYFDDSQRLATQNAGQIAGLNVLKVLNEPTAAALAYGLGSDEVEKEETVLVYDLGGGTFDVTIMKISGKKVNVLATGGDRNLGGFDWDNALMTYLQEQFQKEHSIDLCESENGEAQLRDKAEKAKKALTLMEMTSVNLISGSKRLKVDVNRELFDSLTEKLLHRTITLMELVLDDAKLGWKDVTKILLVGGSTRMPSVKRVIEQKVGFAPSCELNPDEVVAMGAAIQARICMAERDPEQKRTLPESLQGIEVKDVNSHSMGILSALDDAGLRMANSIVMPKNTQIPGRISQVFHTLQENQTGLLVTVTEGEDADPAQVKTIGEAQMRIDPHPKHSPINVEFEYDASGIIHVHVTDMVTNKYLGEVRIERKANMNDAQLGMAKREITALRID